MMKEYSAYYTLKTYEYKHLVHLLVNSDNIYNAFVLSFLKEVDGDINKILRIINVGIKSKKKIFNTALANFIVITIKEAIILSNYDDYMRTDGTVSAFELSNLERFTLANIDRQTIIRTFKKYDISYKAKR